MVTPRAREDRDLSHTLWHYRRGSSGPRKHFDGTRAPKFSIVADRFVACIFRITVHLWVQEAFLKFSLTLKLEAVERENRLCSKMRSLARPSPLKRIFLLPPGIGVSRRPSTSEIGR